MDNKKFWDEYFKKVDEEGWSDYPSLFAQYSLSYLPKNGKVLELGAGLGNDSRYFARHGYKVTSTDFSEEALHISQWESLNQKLQIDYINFDLNDPFPFENEVFDAVFAHAVMQYFDNKKVVEIIKEIKRVLVPDGIFATLLRSIDDPILKKSHKVDDIFYKLPTGLMERFFTPEEFSQFTKGKFETIILDMSGQSMEEEHDTYLRFVGRKIIQ